MNAVFTYPMTTHFILLGKLGYGYEHEDLGSLEIEGTEHGVNWAAGVEYSFMPHMEISFEYEGADIESARGDSLQLGLIYKF
jgi:opacity protein-like surface antigen